MQKASHRVVSKQLVLCYLLLPLSRTRIVLRRSVDTIPISTWKHFWHLSLHYVCRLFSDCLIIWRIDDVAQIFLLNSSIVMQVCLMSQAL